MNFNTGCKSPISAGGVKRKCLYITRRTKQDKLSQEKKKKKRGDVIR